MSKEKTRTIPNFADTSPAHQAAIAAGNDHFKSWQYNVADHFKDKSVEEIKQQLKETANSFAVCFEHVIGDFNMATGIRNANAFNAKEVFYVGDKKWDRRAAVGVHNYTEVKWIPTIQDLIKLGTNYTLVGIDNVEGSISIKDYQWPDHTMMVFGEEGTGLTPAMRALCKDIVHIDMFGSVRSFNCGVASGIAMYSFMSKRK